MAATPMNAPPVATLDGTARGAFIVRVYQHLLLALAVFVAAEALLINLGVAGAMYDLVARNSGAWMLVLGGFMLVSWLATNAAHDLLNQSRQYGGLFAIAAAEALIFAPFLHYFFEVQPGGSASVGAAAVITALGFAGLTAVAFTTRRDLSFVRPLLVWGGMSALLLIVAAWLFGLALGMWFSVALIILAGASILYRTQSLLRTYPADAHVGAAVQLFASVMLLFWYVLRLVGQLRG